MAADLFVVPTVTFRLLFVLVILAHDRRRIVYVAVTEQPTAAWTAQQPRNAFPENESPRYLLHDRDSHRVRRILHALAHTSRPRQGHTNHARGRTAVGRRIVAIPEVGGLHHGYNRIAA
jgi:hypothetical protein